VIINILIVQSTLFNREKLTLQAEPIISTENLLIYLVNPSHFSLMQEYEVNNKKHLAPWQPLRNAEYYTELTTQQRIEQSHQQFLNGNSVFLAAKSLSKVKGADNIIAVASFTNIIRGSFLACNLGYSVDKKYEGQGLMFEMLNASITYMFTQHRMHRIMANYIPSNKRSERLLQRLGFTVEGKAKSYLKINGSWQDHVLTSLINPNDS
jgi:ribosomal-protein-alanine N-acetyltransferase